MRYFKWLRALFIVGFFFFITPNSTADDTSSLLQATQYATSVSNFSIQNFTFADQYLGDTFEVSIGSFFRHLGDDIASGLEEIGNALVEAADALKSAVETAISAVKSAITVAAEDAGDALKKAGEVTGDFIKAHGVLIGMIAGAILLTVVTDGMMGPAVGELVADDIAVAATEAGVEAGTEATEAGTEAASEAGGDAASKASEAAGESAADGGADSATTIDEDVAAAMNNGSTKVETMAMKGVRVFSWYSREVEMEAVIEAIKNKNIKGALLGLGQLQTKIGGNTATNPISVNNYISTVKQMLKDFESNNAAPNSPASQTQLTNVLQQAQALQQQITAQVTAATAQLPAGSDPANIAAAYGVIAAAAQSAANPSGLTAIQQTTVQEWATQHNTASDVVFLAAAIKFANLYNAAQGGTPAQQAAYQAFAAKLPASGLGTIMQFAASGQLVSNTTALSNQSLLLINPYEYYLTQQIQAEQNNLTAQQNQTNLATSVTVTNSSNYAIAQMAAALNGLTPAQRQAVMNSFAGKALTLGDTGALAAVQQYISPNGTVTNNNIPTTQTETVQTVITNAQNNINAASAQLTASQNLTNGYAYSDYQQNLAANSSNLQQVAANIPQVSTPATTASVQAQIANSGLSATSQASLTAFVTQNSSQAGTANAVSATLQYAQLFNAAYGTSNPSASAQQAFANYLNALSPNTAVTMMNFAVSQGLVSKQSALLITDPAQYLSNVGSPTAIQTHNTDLVNALIALVTAQQNLNSSYSVSELESMGATPQQAQAYEAPIAAAYTTALKNVNAIQPPYMISSFNYGMGTIYSLTKGWSKAQLQALSARLYYGSILNGSGLASTVQNYLTPTGTYQNNPQTIQQQNIQAAAKITLQTVTQGGFYPAMTPGVLAQYLKTLPPAQAQQYASGYQQYINYGYGAPTSAQAMYGNVFARYNQAQGCYEGSCSGTPTPAATSVPLNATPAVPDSEMNPPATTASTPAATSTATLAIAAAPATTTPPPVTSAIPPAAKEITQESNNSQAGMGVEGYIPAYS